MDLFPTHSEEIHRFQLLESDAERRYLEAIESMDNEGAAHAAQEWKRACEALDALLEYPRPPAAAPALTVQA